MTKSPALVLIHGGQHDSRCWQPTIDAIARLAPEVRTLAVNLPGRQGVPGDLATLSIAECVEAAIGQIERARPRRGRQARSGPVRRIICVTCSLPPQGKRILDTLMPPIRMAASTAGNELPRGCSATA
jgi:hypothetical protein